MKTNPSARKASSTSPRAATNESPQTIDEYIASFPAEVQKLLRQVRRTIAKAAPEAEEVISYRIPGFKLHGYLIYFAGFKKHIGMYPARIEKFKQELAAYKGGKGTVQFPLDKPLPIDLITRIVKHRVKENLERAAQKKSAGKQVVIGKKAAKKPTETKAAKKSVKKAPVKKSAAKKGAVKRAET